MTRGLFTLYFVSFGIGISEIGFLKALHPGIWGILQLLIAMAVLVKKLKVKKKKRLGSVCDRMLMPWNSCIDHKETENM